MKAQLSSLLVSSVLTFPAFAEVNIATDLTRQQAIDTQYNFDLCAASANQGNGTLDQCTETYRKEIEFYKQLNINVVKRAKEIKEQRQKEDAERQAKFDKRYEEKQQARAEERERLYVINETTKHTLDSSPVVQIEHHKERLFSPEKFTLNGIEIKRGEINETKGVNYTLEQSMQITTYQSKYSTLARQRYYFANEQQNTNSFWVKCFRNIDQYGKTYEDNSQYCSDTLVRINGTLHKIDIKTLGWVN